jgi:cytoskeletal protein CcmA (bactofilin family)
VHAGLKAREIVIYGSIQGNVEAADKIDIRKEAKLVGDIKTSRIMIEDGAYFKGSIDITKTAQPQRPAGPTAQLGSVAAAAPMNAPAINVGPGNK